MEIVISTCQASPRDSDGDTIPVSINSVLPTTVRILTSAFSTVVTFETLYHAVAGSSSSRGVNQVTPKKNGLKNGGGGGPMKQRDDECFGDGMEERLDTDFDFEGNLALFDKAAVFSQIDTSERRGNGTRSRGTPGEQTPSRYRHDENILEAKPIVYRQIDVPQPGAKEYCTGE